MKLGLICTTEIIASTSGASGVVTNELKAQARVFDKVNVIDANLIGCPAYNVPPNPFFIDYMASEIVRSKNIKFALAHFNGDPFGRTVEDVRKINPECKIVTDCPAHELSESIKEWNAVYGVYPFAHLTHPYLFKLYTKHIKESDVTLAASRTSKRFIEKHMDAKDVRVIRHGTDIPDYVEPSPDFKVGYLGAIGPDKGLKYLFVAWGAYTHADGDLVFAGKNVESLVEWKGSLEKVNPQARVELRGYVDNKWDFYNDISVYVQPSVTEGFGIPIIEAMAAGRPVIASKGAGGSEIVKSGKSGFVFKSRDSETLINHINYFHDNPSEIKRMGMEARNTAKKYTWTKIQKQYIKLYKELI